MATCHRDSAPVPLSFAFPILKPEPAAAKDTKPSPCLLARIDLSLALVLQCSLRHGVRSFNVQARRSQSGDGAQSARNPQSPFRRM
jgi:hypothetical protein